MAQRKFTTYAAKMRQANREALATVAALFVIVVAWLSWGIGLADSDIELFSTPIWIIGGCVGTWIVAVLAAIVLGCGVFANFSLEDEAEAELAVPTEAAPASAPIPATAPAPAPAPGTFPVPASPMTAAAMPENATEEAPRG